MNQEYSKTRVEETPQKKTKYESITNRDNYNISIDDIHLENSSSWDTDDYPKSNDTIKNFITFLKLIDARIN